MVITIEPIQCKAEVGERFTMERDMAISPIASEHRKKCVLKTYVKALNMWLIPQSRSIRCTEENTSISVRVFIYVSDHRFE